MPNAVAAAWNNDLALLFISRAAVQVRTHLTLLASRNET